MVKRITLQNGIKVILEYMPILDTVSTGFFFITGSANDIIESGSKLFVLTALDYNANISYDKEAARYFSKIGAKVGALTPNKLSKWIGEVIS